MVHIFKTVNERDSAEKETIVKCNGAKEENLNKCLVQRNKQ